MKSVQELNKMLLKNILVKDELRKRKFNEELFVSDVETLIKQLKQIYFCRKYGKSLRDAIRAARETEITMYKSLTNLLDYNREMKENCRQYMLHNDNETCVVCYYVKIDETMSIGTYDPQKLNYTYYENKTLKHVHKTVAIQCDNQDDVVNNKTDGCNDDSEATTSIQSTSISTIVRDKVKQPSVTGSLVCPVKLQPPKRSNKRWGVTKRGRRCETLPKINFREINWYVGVDPPKDISLGIDIECGIFRKTNKMVPLWIAVCSRLKVRQLQKYGMKSNVVFHCFIKHNPYEVNPLTKFSGVKKEDMINGVQWSDAKVKTKYYLDNYQIIGKAVKNDLKTLELPEYADRENIVDIETIFIGKEGSNDKLSLRSLAYSVKDKLIQEYDMSSQGHSPIIDSQLTLELYKRHLSNKISPEIDETGSLSYQWVRDKEEKNPAIVKIKNEIRANRRAQRVAKRTKQN